MDGPIPKEKDYQAIANKLNPVFNSRHIAVTRYLVQLREWVWSHPP
jgi:hypothetical protein